MGVGSRAKQEEVRGGTPLCLCVAGLVLGCPGCCLACLGVCVFCVELFGWPGCLQAGASAAGRARAGGLRSDGGRGLRAATTRLTSSNGLAR